MALSTSNNVLPSQEEQKLGEVLNQVRIEQGKFEDIQKDLEKSKSLLCVLQDEIKSFGAVKDGFVAEIKELEAKKKTIEKELGGLINSENEQYELIDKLRSEKRNLMNECFKTKDEYSSVLRLTEQAKDEAKKETQKELAELETKKEKIVLQILEGKKTVGLNEASIVSLKNEKEKIEKELAEIGSLIDKKKAELAEAKKELKQIIDETEKAKKDYQKLKKENETELGEILKQVEEKQKTLGELTANISVKDADIINLAKREEQLNLATIKIKEIYNRSGIKLEI